MKRRISLLISSVYIFYQAEACDKETHPILVTHKRHGEHRNPTKSCFMRAQESCVAYKHLDPLISEEIRLRNPGFDQHVAGNAILQFIRFKLPDKLIFWHRIESFDELLEDRVRKFFSLECRSDGEEDKPILSTGDEVGEVLEERNFLISWFLSVSQTLFIEPVQKYYPTGSKACFPFSCFS